MQKLGSAELFCWQYIQEHLDEIPKLSISQLADVIHVSPSTIVRTLKKKGYSGYTSFKSILYYSESKKENGFSKEVNLVIKKNEVEISRTISQLSVDDIEKAVYLLSQQENILICSSGLNTAVAKEIMYKLRLFGKNCANYNDFDYIQYYAERANQKTLVIAVSLSGATPEIIKALECARKRKAKIITITAGATSKMVELSDVTLFAYKSEHKEVNFGLDVGSRIPLEVVSRILIDTFAVYKRLGPIRGGKMTQ